MHPVIEKSWKIDIIKASEEKKKIYNLKKSTTSVVLQITRDGIFFKSLFKIST